MNLDAQEAALGLLGLSPTNLTPTTVLRPPASTIPSKRKHREEGESGGVEGIDCICGFEVDDGFSIACDVCSRWCHSACFDVAAEEIPDQFKCWTCKPRPASFKERAVRMQKERLELGVVVEKEKQRRKASPGVERKQRRVSVDKRKRRASVVVNEDEHVEVDEPWTQSYVPIAQDIISDDETRVKLRRQAQHWRGVTAVADSSPVVKELPPAALSSYSNPHILPPAYSLHTAAPITSNRLITDYKSSIIPSSSYLSDPLNAYAHLGMPKPFVHLFGPPLDVALDSRLAGNHGRFARSGCRPNAVLRPLLCDDSDNLGFGVFALRDLKANEEVVLGWEWDDGNAVHNLPALLNTPHIFPPRQVQHLRHQMSNILHALSSTFTTCACGSRAQDCAINRMAAFVDGVPAHGSQHDLGPLVGRKRGFKTRERIPLSGGMGGMVMCRDDETPASQPLPAFALSPSSPIVQSVKGKERATDEDIEMGDGRHSCASESNSCQPIKHQSPRAALRSPNLLKSHSTFDLRPPDPGGPSRDRSQPENEDSMPPKMRKRWMHRELEALRELNGNTSPCSSSHVSQSPGGSSNSLGSPPSKWRKRGYANGCGHDRLQFENGPQVDDTQTSMPPPPMPASLDPTTISSTTSSLNVIQHPTVPSISPLNSFANLSLLSPALFGTTPPPSAPSFPSPATSITASTGVVPPKDHTAAWSPLRRYTASLPSKSPPPSHPVPVPSSPHPNDTGSIASTSSSPINPAKDIDERPIEYSPSPPPSPSSLQPETLLMNADDKIQSTPHSPDPTWRADSPSGDHVHPESDVNGDESHLVKDWDSPAFGGDHGAQMDLDIASSRSLSPASRVVPGDTAAMVVDTEISNNDTRLESPPPSHEPSSVPHPDPTSSTPQQTVKEEEETRSESSPEQPSHPPPPKVKMSLRDFALRKKKQREEQEMTKSAQDSLPGEHVDGENGTLVGEPENPGLEKDSVGKEVLGQTSFVKDEVVDVPGPSSLKPIMINGYQRQSSNPSSSSSPPHATPIQATSLTTTTRQTKQELIEQPIPTATARYAAMYNNSRSISPINPDPHHFQSYSPPRLYQEDGEIGEIMDTPPPLSTPAAPTVNRSESAVPSGSSTPLPRGPISKRPDFRSTSSSQARHSPPTHPRSFNASPPYRPIQQPPPASTPPPAARGTGGVPPTAPRAPRALRQYMLPNRPAPTTTPTAMTTSSSSSTNSSSASSTPALPASSYLTVISNTTVPTSNGRLMPFIPRGPSADRERVWDIDQIQYGRSFTRRDSREGGHAWGGR